MIESSAAADINILFKKKNLFWMHLLLDSSINVLMGPSMRLLCAPKYNCCVLKEGLGGYQLAQSRPARGSIATAISPLWIHIG